MVKERAFDKVTLVAIYEIARVLNSSLILHKTLRQALSLVATQLEIQRGMVCTLESFNDLTVLASVGFSKEEADRARFKVGEGITGKIFQMGVPAVVPDVVQEPLFLNRTGAHRTFDDKAVAFIGVPIKIARECIGVLSFERYAGQKRVGYVLTCNI